MLTKVINAVVNGIMFVFLSFSVVVTAMYLYIMFTARP